MNSLVLFKTNSGNRYFYDFKMNRTLLCHSVLFYLLELYKKGVNLEKWFAGIKSPVTIEDSSFSKKELEYYYKKFLLLKENGYFTEIDNRAIISGRLDAKSIKFTLANMRQVVFEVTDNCNLQCEYCGYGKFYKDYDKRTGKNLRLDIAKNTLQYLSKLWNSSLNVSHGPPIAVSFYGGEPLLNMPFIKEIVGFVKKLKVIHNQFRFSMTTNGVLLEKYMDFLVENDFSLLVSLDGNEVNDSYRPFRSGKPSFEYVVKGIKALKKKYPDYFNRKVNFNAVLHNKNSVSEIHRYFKSAFKKMPHIAELNTTGIKPSRKKEFWNTYRNFYESLHQAEDYSLIEKDMFIELPDVAGALSFVHQFSGSVYKDYNDLLYSSARMARSPTGTCHPFLKKMFLTVNGKILPCERISQRYGLGFADEKKIELNFEELAQKYNEYYDKMRKRCNVCFNFQSCVQCIFHLETLDEKIPQCNGFMNYNEFGRYLSARMSFLEEKPKIYSRLMKEVKVD